MSRHKLDDSTLVMAEQISWYCALFLALMLAMSCCEESRGKFFQVQRERNEGTDLAKNNNVNSPCDRIYVVSEGETVYSITEKCGDPHIVERNPHINDPDDVFPGILIKITPNYNSN